MVNKAADLIGKIRNYAHEEHLDSNSQKYEKTDPRLIAAALEIAAGSKNTLGGLYYDFRRSDSGLFRKIKNKLIGKVANIVRNTTERPFLTQQKFNEQAYFLIETLFEQNKKLTQRVAELEKQNKS
ncbi:MAG: hypothetical protein ACOCXP_02725 [Candidatus Dojkabacteria bacterium]